ncbi:hypothetical protein Cgig2_023083 [Carnegiea gigantea]|uniref:Uncharacterized protein n=1 Tax=Carnegiea gigantea TaxID=171969 RepID=A0A9Q1JHX0_9CARY|nr:hypothetical protein Cgig2_023083 [Carnegiea gigantea]
MWAKDAMFKDLIQHNMEKSMPISKLQALKHFLCSSRHSLKQLNRSTYADIYEQQAQTRAALVQIQSQLQEDPHNVELLHKENTSRQYYITINQSTISLIRQQSKAEWIGYGDECSRDETKEGCNLYLPRLNHHDQWVQGFEDVADVVTDYYKDLLRK